MILKLCRPRSFHSPVQSAFGLYLSQQYGSKNLIEICSSLRYSALYYETEVYLRVERVQAGDFAVSFNVPVQMYGKRVKSGLKKLSIENLSDSIPAHNILSIRNLLWLSSFAFDPVTLPGWSGCMRNCYDSRENYETSYILALTFINVDLEIQLLFTLLSVLLPRKQISRSAMYCNIRPTTFSQSI